MSSSSSASSSSGGTYPGPPAGGPTASWADCSLGVVPGTNGGDLLWAETAPFPTSPSIPACTAAPYSLEALAVGPTGDIALGVVCPTKDMALAPFYAAYQRFNGSGYNFVSAEYWPANNIGDEAYLAWTSLLVTSDNDLSVDLAGVVPCDDMACNGEVVDVDQQRMPGGEGVQSPFFCTAPLSSRVNGYCSSTTSLAVQTLTPAGQAVSPSGGIPDGAGGTYFFGALTAPLDAGSCGMLTPTGSGNGYVFHVDPTSSCVYSRVLPAAPAVVADTKGAVLSASSTTSLDLGCGTLAAASGGSTFVTRLDPSGACVFGKSLPAPGLGVALDPAGSAVVSGLVGAAAFDFGGGALAPLGTQDIVLGELDGSGSYLWGRRFGGPGITFAGPYVSTAMSGDVYLRTGWSGAVDLGGGPITAASNDTVVARYASSGTCVWGRDFPIVGKYLAGVDGCGSLVVASEDSTFDPGQGTVLPQPPATPTPLTAIVRYAP